MCYFGVGGGVVVVCFVLCFVRGGFVVGCGCLDVVVFIG